MQLPGSLRSSAQRRVSGNPDSPLLLGLECGFRGLGLGVYFLGFRV